MLSDPQLGATIVTDVDSVFLMFFERLEEAVRRPVYGDGVFSNGYMIKAGRTSTGAIIVPAFGRGKRNFPVLR
mgnify:CR=1 FL=1